MNRRVTKNGLRFLLAASLATFVGCSKSDADETSAGSESTGGSDCLEINEGAGGEDCDSTMCGPGEYCLGGGICELGCRKTVTCAMGEYCDLSTADPITAGKAKEFYQHFGFLALPDLSNRLVLPIKTALDLFED